jgi:membrane-associated phospholipid phosphatase
VSEPAVPEPAAPAASAIDRFDEVVDGWFDHLRGRPAWDRVFYTASELGDWSLIWHLLGAAQGAVRPDGFARTVRLSLALGAESALVNGGIKRLFGRGRPVTEVERPHHLRTPRTSSFPSGHASSAFLAAALLSQGSRARPLYYGAAVVVATSRIHVRIHHASDVVGGALLGVALGRLALRAWPQPELS